jgi:hypothetical protein
MTARAFAPLLWAAVLWASGVSGAAEPRASKPRISSNGLYAIRRLDDGAGKCQVEVTKERQVAWVLEKCVGVVDDAFFVSDDGEAFWWLSTVPEIPRRKGRVARDLARSVVVATLFDKGGDAKKALRLSHFVSREESRHLRWLSGHVQWLKGVGRVPGKAPRVTEQNEVEFETVASKRQTLAF